LPVGKLNADDAGVPLPGFSGSLRRCLCREAERVAIFVHDPGASWSGLLWR
jgi:hypothetical protein